MDQYPEDDFECPVSICIIGFVIAYRYVARRLRIANIQLYGVRDLSLASFAGIMLSVGQASFFYQIGTFFQKIQGVGPVESGLRILPLVLAMMVATFLIVRLSMYFGARRLISGGMLVMAIGTAGLFIIREDTPYGQLLIPILLMGFGFGIATPARTVVVLTVPPHGIVGMSAGVNTAAGQSGFALGTIISSILVTVFARDQFINKLQANNVPPDVIEAVSKAYESIFARVISGNLERLPDSVAQAVTVPFAASFSIALGETYLVIGVMLAVAAGVIFVPMNRGLKGTFVNTPLAQLGSVQPAVVADASAATVAPNA